MLIASHAMKTRATCFTFPTFLWCNRLCRANAAEIRRKALEEISVEKIAIVEIYLECCEWKVMKGVLYFFKY